MKIVLLLFFIIASCSSYELKGETLLNEIQERNYVACATGVKHVTELNPDYMFIYLELLKITCSRIATATSLSESLYCISGAASAISQLTDVSIDEVTTEESLVIISETFCPNFIIKK